MRSGPVRRLNNNRPAPPDPEGGGGGLDRISDLPDELLHLVLVRLGCAREAARASLLSRRWRGLWTRAPELVFNGVGVASVVAALSRVAIPALVRLDISLRGEAVTPARVRSLLRAAARLAPQKLAVSTGFILGDGRNAVKLPGFGRTTSLRLQLRGIQFTPPRSGEFAALRSLFLTSNRVDPGVLLPICPGLRLLHFVACHGLGVVTIHSTSLEEVVVKSNYDDNAIRRIDIVAPVLKDVRFDINMASEFRVSMSAPSVKKLYWECENLHKNVGIGDLRLNILKYSLSHGVRKLSLGIDCDYYDGYPDAERSFAEEIAQLAVTEFSELELDLCTKGHAFGPLVLHLLSICPDILWLEVKLDSQGKVGKSCSPNCPCEHPSNWSGESVPLMALQMVRIHGFRGGNDEIDFLKLLFRCASMLQSMVVGVSDKGYKKICKMCEEYEHVQWHVYHI